MDTKGAQLVGSVKQIRFAEVIRAAWVAGQLEQIAKEERIAAGDFSGLVIGPHEEGTSAAFAEVLVTRRRRLAEILRVTSAKQWIEGAEGQWFRVNNPRPPSRYGRSSYRATRSRGICEDAPCCGCCGPQSDNADHWGGM